MPPGAYVRPVCICQTESALGCASNGAPLRAWTYVRGMLLASAAMLLRPPDR